MNERCQKFIHILFHRQCAISKLMHVLEYSREHGSTRKSDKPKNSTLIHGWPHPHPRSFSLNDNAKTRSPVSSENIYTHLVQSLRLPSIQLKNYKTTTIDDTKMSYFLTHWLAFRCREMQRRRKRLMI